MKFLKKKLLFSLFLNDSEYHAYKYLYFRTGEFEAGSVRGAVNELVNEGLADKLKRNRRSRFRLTANGREFLLKNLPCLSRESRPWDKRWRIAIIVNKIGPALRPLQGIGYRHMHPVKIALSPDMKSPEDLPLDKDGKITCITCHDVMEGHGVVRKRRMVGRALCLNCHADTDILAEVVWFPPRLKRGEKGRLEVKVVEFRIPRKKSSLGDTVLLYYYAKGPSG